MIPRTNARITEKIGRELNSGARPSGEALAAGPILAESTIGGADGSDRPLDRAKARDIGQPRSGRCDPVS